MADTLPMRPSKVNRADCLSGCDPLSGAARSLAAASLAMPRPKVGAKRQIGRNGKLG
jgi:hypothetical protein